MTVAFLCGCSMKKDIIGYMQNGYILDKDKDIRANYSNGYILDLDGNIAATYRNGHIFNTSDSIIAYYSNGFILKNEVSSPPLEESCWRDDASGDWIIGIYPEGVVYDSKFWEFTGRDVNADVLFLHNDDNESLIIKIGKEKDGKRSFKIGSDKTRILSRITGEALPAYPSKDYRSKFVDTGYQREDSVTISGWIRGLSPEVIQQFGNNITILYSPFDLRKTISVDMDSIGRFSITIPVLNSSRVTIDAKGPCIPIPVEPGEKYYLLVDFRGDKLMIMGDDVRMQNELMSHLLSIKPFDVGKYTYDIIDRVENWRLSMNASIDSIRMAQPTLSELTLDYIREDAIADVAYSLGQLRSRYPFDKLPQPESEYIRKTFWNCLTKPVSLYPFYMLFMKDFVNSELFNSDYILQPKHGANYAILFTPKKVVDEVKSDHKFLQECIKDGSFNYLFLLPDTIQNTVERIHRRAGEILQSEGLSPEDEFQYKDVLSHIDILNDLKATPEIIDLYLMMYCIDQMDHEVIPLSNLVKNTLDSVISFPGVRDQIHRHSDRSEKMKQKPPIFEFSINNGDEVRDITEGKTLLEKLVEPYRGKFVLIDIWGTWCGPCKKAMKEFIKEYETLSPYGVTFLFFANNSENEVIKTVVSEYNVIGEEVFHYNLPEKQQKALEKYLKVDSYPTYILVDPEGQIVKEHVNVIDLKSLEQLIIKVKKNQFD